MPRADPTPEQRVSRYAPLAGFTVAMTAVIVVSNILVQTPVTDWLTWGAITYPFSFLITDLANRYHGPRFARQVVYAGFVVAVVLSAWYATPRIALASGIAFLVAELVDVRVFDRLRRRTWWQAPLISTCVGSALDTLLFFGLAFYATDMPWVTLAIGDFGVKLALALLTLLPFRAALALVRPPV
jgi:queuosine precursor transporter